MTSFSVQYSAPAMSFSSSTHDHIAAQPREACYFMTINCQNSWMRCAMCRYVRAGSHSSDGDGV
jgi:hypothetical protein